MDLIEEYTEEAARVKSNLNDPKNRVRDIINLNNNIVRLRHECLCQAGSTLFNHVNKEMKFTDCLALALTVEEVANVAEEARHSKPKVNIENMTPDGYKYEESSGRKKLTFFEYGLSVKSAEYKIQKEEKYGVVIDLIRSWLKRYKPHEEIQVNLNVITVNPYEENPAAVLTNFPLIRKEKCNILWLNDVFRKAKRISMMIDSMKSSLTEEERDQISTKLCYNIKDSNKCVKIVINETKVNEMMGGLNHCMPQLDLSKCKSYNKSNKDIAREMVRTYKREGYDSGFEKPTKEGFNKCLRENVIEKIKSDFVIKEKTGPSFHLYYTNPDGAGERMKDSFYNWRHDLRRTEYNSETCLMKDIFCADFQNNDELVMFHEGKIENWDFVRKQLVKVREPRTLGWGGLSTITKEFLKSQGIGSKKAFKADREKKLMERTNNGGDPKRKNETLAFWEKDVAIEVTEECDYMASWLLKKPETELRIKKDWMEDSKEYNEAKGGIMKNSLMNAVFTDLCSRNVAFVSKHYEDVARGILFKSKSTNKGLHVMNFNNPNVYVVTLQGMDIYKDKGEVRFFTVVRQDKTKQPDMFPNNKPERIIKGEKYNYYMSKIYSFNRSRWEHFSRTDPLASLSLIIYKLIMCQNDKVRRVTMDSESIDKLGIERFINAYCKQIILMYTTANFAGQNKISGLIDHFRYMLPAALSDYSGLLDYVKTKFIKGLKTATQVKLFYCIRRCILSYLDESSKLTRSKLEELNEDIAIEEGGEMDTETIGLKIPLKQAFGELMWDSREDAFAEINMAFFLTAKDLYNDFHRNLDFYNGVVGGEMEFREKIEPLFKSNEMHVGFLLRDWDRYKNIKRGGFFCQEAALMNGRIIGNIVNANRIDLEMSVEKEGIYDNVMGLDFLTSTRSSLKNEAKGATYTMLESCLDEVERLEPELQGKINELVEWMKSGFVDIYNNKSDILDSIQRSMAEKESERTSGHEADVSGSESSKNSKEFKPVQKIEEKMEFDDGARSVGTDESFEVFEPSDEEKKYFSDKDKNMIANLFVKHIISTNYKKLKLPEVAQIVDTFCKKYQSELFDRVEEIELMTERESDMYHGKISSLSLINLGLEHLKTPGCFKMVSKGQRTEKDREIFIENKGRFTDATLEHTLKKVCELIPEEQITRKGDMKAIDLKLMQSRAFKWKSEPCSPNLPRGKKTLLFLTGDMTKWSNHDTMQRLHFINNVAAEKTAGNLGKIIRLFGRSNGVRGIKLPDKFKENKPLFEKIKKELSELGSEFPIVKIKQNWLQGIRNYNSTLAHYGAMESIRYVMNEMLGDDIYIDFLVHSDDFVMAIGLAHETDINGKFSKTINYVDDLEDYFRGLKPIDIINFCCYILKLNNNTVSIKKSSIHKLLMEMVSNYCVRGSLGMGSEKQLTAMFAETSNLGNKDDVNGIISNSNNAITKGAATSTVDLFLWHSLRKMRNNYSFAKGMRFDPVSRFDIDENYIPLQFFPKLKHTSLLHFFSSCDIHDIINFIELYDKYKSYRITERETRSLALYCCLSKCNRKENIDVEKFGTKTSYFCSFRFRMGKLDEDDISHKDCIPKYGIDLFKLLDPTYEIYRSHDVVSLYLDLHDRANNTMIRQGLVRKTKATVIKLRGVSANEKNIRWSDDKKFMSLEDWFGEVRKGLDELVVDNNMLNEVCESLRTELDNTFNYAIPTIKWLMNIEVGSVVERYKKIRNDLLRVPGIESENSFLNNSIGKLLTYEYCNMKFAKMHPYSTNTYSMNSEIAQIKRKAKELNLDDNDPKEMRMIINTLDKYYKEGERSKLICTRAVAKGFMNYEDAIKHVIKNNTVENSHVYINIRGKVEGDMTKESVRRRFNIGHLNAIYLLERFAYYNNITLDYEIQGEEKHDYLREMIKNVKFDRDTKSLKCAIWTEARVLRTYTLAEKFDRSNMIVKYYEQDADFVSGESRKHMNAMIYFKLYSNVYLIIAKNGELTLKTNATTASIIYFLSRVDLLWGRFKIETYRVNSTKHNDYIYGTKTNKGIHYSRGRRWRPDACMTVYRLEKFWEEKEIIAIYQMDKDGYRVRHMDRTICNASYGLTSGDFETINIRIKDNTIIDLNEVMMRGNDFTNRILNAEVDVINKVPYNYFADELSDNSQRMVNSLLKLRGKHERLKDLAVLSAEDEQSGSELIEESDFEEVDDFDFEFTPELKDDIDYNYDTEDEPKSSTESSTEEVLDFDFGIVLNESKTKKTKKDEYKPRIRNVINAIMGSYWNLRQIDITNEHIVLLVVAVINEIGGHELLTETKSKKMNVLREMLIYLIENNFDRDNCDFVKRTKRTLEISRSIKYGNNNMKEYINEVINEVSQFVPDE